MSFANLRRVKEMLELIVPSLVERDDYDPNVNRLMNVAHERIRLMIVELNGGTMPLFLELAAKAATSTPVTLVALTNENRRIRIRLTEADETQLEATPMVATITGVQDGIETTEDVELTENGEFVSNKSWTSVDTSMPIDPIIGTPGQIEVLEDIDPVLVEVEELWTACLFMTEAVERFQKETEPMKVEIWCQKAKKLLEKWIEGNLKEDVLDQPLGLRAES